MNSNITFIALFFFPLTGLWGFFPSFSRYRFDGRREVGGSALPGLGVEKGLAREL